MIPPHSHHGKPQCVCKRSRVHGTHYPLRRHTKCTQASTMFHPQHGPRKSQSGDTSQPTSLSDLTMGDFTPYPQRKLSRLANFSRLAFARTRHRVQLCVSCVHAHDTHKTATGTKQSLHEHTARSPETTRTH